MIVVDASVMLGLVLPLPYSDRATARIRSLKEGREEMYAPALLEYEMSFALPRAIAQGIVDEQWARSALALMDELHAHPITAGSSLHSRLFLTADESLVRSARAAGADWVSGLG